MKIVYAYEKAPEALSKSIFLAGPTPRSEGVKSWRPDALRELRSAGYDGVVFVPEPRDSSWSRDYDAQIGWEDRHLNMADVILFWVPRDLATLPAFTTNVEFGFWADSGKAVFGAPLREGGDEFPKNRYLRHYSEQFGLPSKHTLRETVRAALDKIGDGAERSGGERDVPLFIWNTPHFQSWYGAQKKAGNRLEGARVLWTFRVGPERDIVFFLALHVDMHVTSENRRKTHEIILLRPDISTVVMYHRAENLPDSDVVLVREFRSPAATEDGFVWENPGGSSFTPTSDPLTLAVDECREEMGLSIAPDRMRRHEARQVVSTMSAHRAHLFSVELTEEEMAWIRSKKGEAFGVASETERTYVEVMKLRDILAGTKVDWSMLGMILSVLR